MARPIFQGDETREEMAEKLADLEPLERQIFFRSEFNRLVEPLQLIERPSLSEEYPEFADDILTSYLTHTTFTLKVWVNYDAAWKQFYQDGRLQDCGQLVIKQQDRAVMNEVRSGEVEFRRVRLEIGTAFKTLFYINLRSASSGRTRGEAITARLKDLTSQHPILREFIADVCDELERCNLPEDQTGFKIHNIEQIAGMLVREPTQEELQEYRYWRERSIWMMDW